MFSNDITKKITSLFFVFLFVFFASFFVVPTKQTYAGLDCPTGFDDCDCNVNTGTGGCELNVSSDALNCGKCGNVCSSGRCVDGSCAPITGGLVPCGRMYDNPSTIYNEQEPCNICHIVPLADNIINYLIDIVALVTVLSIVIGALMSVTSLGGSTGLARAKTAISKSLLGFAIVLVAWAIINVGMVLFGFNDPFGDGSWAKFNCNLATTPINRFCGDGLVDNPNSDGINEVCDPKELKNDFITRTGKSASDWVKTIYSCNPKTCDFGCASDPLANKIGEGCYQPTLKDGGTGTACQKGKYVCDFSKNNGNGEVVCQNTFNNPAYRLAGHYCKDVFDECCKNTKDSKAVLQNLSYTTEKPSGTYYCDDICKNSGKICVGVGLDDIPSHLCVSVSNHSGGSCAGFNLTSNDCKSTYSESTGANCVEPGSESIFTVGGTGCYCL